MSIIVGLVILVFAWSIGKSINREYSRSAHRDWHPLPPLNIVNYPREKTEHHFLRHVAVYLRESWPSQQKWIDDIGVVEWSWYVVRDIYDEYERDWSTEGPLPHDAELSPMLVDYAVMKMRERASQMPQIGATQ